MSTRRRRGNSARVSGKQGGEQGAALTFLSPEWVREVARVVDSARRSDEYFRRLSSAFSLRVTYSIAGLPAALRPSYGGKSEATVCVELVRGRLQTLQIGNCVCGPDPDFTVTSDYPTAQRIFRGELSPARALAERMLRVEPAASIYRRPGFTAKTLIVAGLVLKYARRVVTRFETDGETAGSA
jgi:hypothetical protein